MKYRVSRAVELSRTLCIRSMWRSGVRARRMLGNRCRSFRKKKVMKAMLNRATTRFPATEKRPERAPPSPFSPRAADRALPRLAVSIQAVGSTPCASRRGSHSTNSTSSSLAVPWKSSPAKAPASAEMSGANRLTSRLRAVKSTTRVRMAPMVDPMGRPAMRMRSQSPTSGRPMKLSAMEMMR